MKRLFSLLMILGLSFFLASAVEAEISANDQYTVGIEDVLDIKVLGHPDLRSLATVASDGSITFPYLGTVYVKGKRLSEIEKELTERLSEGFIKYPSVTVALVKSMSRKIFVYGEVARSGEIAFEGDMTVVKAISVAGGITTNGLHGKIKVRRMQKGKQGYKDIDIGLRGVIEDSAAGDMPLQPDDIVIVERNKTIFVHGEVSRPGEYVLEKDMTVVKAISVAGGITVNGLYGKVKVRRKQDGSPGYKDIDIDLKGVIEGSATGDMSLQPDDIVIVEHNKTFFVHGEVNRPGEYVLKDDMTVLKAVSLAGGFTKWGSSSRVKVLRQKESYTGYEIIKVDIDDVVDGDATEDVILQPGDIVIVSEGIF